jgi:hypothetical protein
LGAVTRGGFFLKQVEATLVDLGHIPLSPGEETVEAGLVGGLSELAVDARDVLALGHEQAGEILSKVPALGFIGQQVGEVIEGFLDDGGKVDDAGHSCLPRRGTITSR